MKWGRCADVGELVANVTLFGGATGVWDPVAGTFVATLQAGEFCGGSASFELAQVVLKARGCGTLRVTIDGEGERYSEERAQADAVSGDRALVGNSPGGFLTDCSSGPLVFVDDVAVIDFPVRCDDEVTLRFFSLQNEYQPVLTCTFVVESV